MTIVRRILRFLGWGTAAVLVSVFLIGYAAPYLSPIRFWWTDLFAVGLPFASVGVAALGIVLCGWGGYRRRWGRVVLGGILLVLLTIRFGPRLAAWGPFISEPEGFRLMTFNVPPSASKSRPQGAHLVDLVRREHPDVLAFQESRVRTASGEEGSIAWVSSSINVLLDSLRSYGVPRHLPPDTIIQQPVMGRLSLDTLSVHPLPPNGETNARSRYTRTQFSWQGRPAVLYNIHLHSVGRARPWTLMPDEWTSWERWTTFLRTYREGALRRAQQARLLRRRIERESRPVLVVGDFNSTPHQWAYWHIARGLQSAVNRRLRGWGATFPARRPLVQIDHVLADPAWQITAARIPANGAAKVSDHRPVLVQLRWKQD